MSSRLTAVVVTVAAVSGAGFAHAETITKEGKNAAGQTCKVTVNKNADGSITTAGVGGSTSSAGGLSSSTSVGGSSVHVQAGNGSVSSSSSVPGSGSSASTITVNGCTISTSSP